MNKTIIFFGIFSMFLWMPAIHADNWTLDWDLDADGNVIGVGEVITDQYAAWGIDIQSYNSVLGVNDAAITFDSANPSGGDNDLATATYNNILILAENFVDTSPADGFIDDPDDQEGAQQTGYIDVFFNQWNAITAEVTFVDVSESNHTLEFYLDSVLVYTDSLNPGPNGNIRTVSYNGFAFDQLRHNFGGSGAIAEITVTTPVPEPNTIVLLGIGGAAAWRRRRQQLAVR